MKGTLRQGKWNEVGITTGEYKEPGSVKSTLELCYLVCSEEERETLRNGSTESVQLEELMQLSATISEQAFMKMWTLEGFDPEAMKAANEKKGSQMKKPTYQAIGKRIRHYKQAVASHTGKECLLICERPDGMPAVTKKKS